MNITLNQQHAMRKACTGSARNGWGQAFPWLAGLAALVWLPLLLAAAPREPSEERLQQVLRRFPDADLNKDGKLTLDEWRQFRRQMQTGGAAGASRPADAAANAPAGTATDAPPAGPQ